VAQFQTTFFFNFETFGWSESFYWSGDGYDTAIKAAERVSIDRLAFMATDCSLVHIRVSDIAKTRDAEFRSYPFGTNTGDGGEQLHDVQNALLFRLRGSDVALRSIMLRGVPDEWVKHMVLNAANAGAKAPEKLKRWTKTLREQGMQIKTYNRAAGETRLVGHRSGILKMSLRPGRI